MRLARSLLGLALACAALLLTNNAEAAFATPKHLRWQTKGSKIIVTAKKVQLKNCKGCDFFLGIAGYKRPGFKFLGWGTKNNSWRNVPYADASSTKKSTWVFDVAKHSGKVQVAILSFVKPKGGKWQLVHSIPIGYVTVKNGKATDRQTFFWTWLHGNKYKRSNIDGGCGWTNVYTFHYAPGQQRLTWKTTYFASCGSGSFVKPVWRLLSGHVKFQGSRWTLQATYREDGDGSPRGNKKRKINGWFWKGPKFKIYGNAISIYDVRYKSWHFNTNCSAPNGKCWMQLDEQF